MRIKHLIRRHSLILDNGECWLLGQGLRAVTLRVFKAPVAKFKKLTVLKVLKVCWCCLPVKRTM